MSRFVQLLLAALLIFTIAAMVWIVMVAKKTPKPGDPMPVSTAQGAGKVPAPGAGQPQGTAPQVQRDPALDAKPEVTAALYPKLANVEKAQIATVKALPDAAKPVSAVTFFQYTSKSPSFADPTGKRVDHFIGGEVIRRCEVAGKGSAGFGWFEMRPGVANQPPPGRDVAPQRVHVALLALTNGNVEFAFAAKRDDVERQFNEAWGCGGSTASAAPVTAAAGKGALK